SCADGVALDSGCDRGRLSAGRRRRVVPSRGKPPRVVASMFKALFENLTSTAAHRGWPRVVGDSDIWRRIGEALREGKLDLLGLWGDGAAVHCALYEPSTRQILSATIDVHDGKVPSLAVFHAPASGGGSAIYLGSNLWRCPIRGRGLITDAGQSVCHWPTSRGLTRRCRPTDSSTLKARVCIRSRSVRCMRGSSSPVISGSRRAARRLSGSKNASVIRTKASRSCCAASRSTKPGELRRACPGTVRWRIRSSSLSPWRRRSSSTRHRARYGCVQ